MKYKYFHLIKCIEISTGGYFVQAWCVLKTDTVYSYQCMIYMSLKPFILNVDPVAVDARWHANTAEDLNSRVNFHIDYNEKYGT